MNVKLIIGQVLAFVFYLAAQVMFGQNMVLFDKAFCFLYVGFLLLLPFDIKPVLLLVIGFFVGLIVDLFYDSPGIHAAACVLIMYLRPHWISLLTPRGGYEAISSPKLKIMGFEWFSSYAFTLISAHQLFLFFVSAWGSGMFFFTLSKVFFSTIFTFLVLVIIQYLVYNKKN